MAGDPEISGKKPAQAGWEKNEERYRFALEAANVGTWEWNISTGEDRWSANMESIHGLAAGSFHGTIEDMMRTVHSEDRDMVRAKIKRSIESGEQYEVEYRTVGQDGKVGWVEAKGRVLYDQRTGQPLRMIGVATNITERKNNQEELSRLAVVVDASEDAITMLALDGTVLSWNKGAQKIYGYSAQEIIGRNIRLMWPADTVQEAERMAASAKRGESLHHAQLKRIRKDGRLIWISANASPIRDSRGEVVAFSSTVRDITEIKVLEEQLRQAAKLESLGVLAGGIAHDFNNLLTGILGNADLVRNTLPPDSPAIPMIDSLIDASQRAATLIRELLAYAGKGKFLIQPVDLSGLVRDITALVQASVPKTVRFRLRLAPRLPAVVADVAQLQQLTMNLIINAAEAIGQNPGLVTVTTGEQQIAEGERGGDPVGADPILPGRYVFFEVEDNGAGMDEATITKIFDPFFTTKFTGRGLGLSAALGIVKSHEGFMQVSSSLGRGSTFKVLFPSRPEKTAPASVPEGKDEPSLSESCTNSPF